MRRLLLLFLLLAAAPATAQAPALELVGEVAFPATASGNGTSDVWGYTAPDGAEYAIVGVLGGTAIVSVPDLEVLHTIPGPQGGDFYYHRDLVVYGDHLYVVAEMTGTNEGLQVIDLGGLPESAELVTTLAPPGNVRSHNMDVDAVAGYAYVLAQNAGSVRILDLADPADPQEVGLVDLPNVHDVHARGDTLYVAEGYSPTFSIWDVSDKQAPELLVRMEVPNSGYVHNIWPSDDGDYVVTTEETQGKTVKVWDVSDLDDVELVGEYLGANGLAHNAHVMGRYVVLSHYAAGVTIVDIADPAHPIEVARYDTTPQSDAGGFFGTWGAYPYTAGGYVYASDFDGKLTVLRLVEDATDAEPAPPTPALHVEAYPNPFRGGATARFELSEAGPVRAVLYDALGREVAVLAEGVHAASPHTLRVGGADLVPGPYFLRLEAGGASRTLTLVRVR
ncbi:MAG: choice-of-anchor B family protein [Rhodothermales bacterium]|nr:choice-of-anchor B family protein [Rhodothermales bacterium]